MSSSMEAFTEIQEAVKGPGCFLASGAGSKSALSCPPEGVQRLDLSGLKGVIEYDPGEYTITALAGTRVREVSDVLRENRQYLPFDPPLVEQGATLGGVVAAGLSGPERYRFGGVRDFLLGVRYVDYAGNLVYGGGKVVKNAAGFDLAKLMVGSLGRLGVLVEITFKVFPQPESYTTMRFDYPDLDGAIHSLIELNGSSLSISAVELEPPGRLWVRAAGPRESMPARLRRLQDLMGKGEVIEGQQEAALWKQMSEMAWVPAGWSLVKIPVTPKRIPALERALAALPCQRRFGGGGQVAWVALQGTPSVLDQPLADQELAGLVVLGPQPTRRIGLRRHDEFALRVKQALDPDGRFPELV